MIEFSVYKMDWKEEETWSVSSWVSQGTFAHVHGFDIAPDGIITHFFNYSHRPKIENERIHKLIALAKDKGLSFMNSKEGGI